MFRYGWADWYIYAYNIVYTKNLRHDNFFEFRYILQLSLNLWDFNYRIYVKLNACNPPPPPPQQQQQQKWTKNMQVLQTATIHACVPNFYEKYIIGNMANVLKIQPPS